MKQFLQKKKKLSGNERMVELLNSCAIETISFDEIDKTFLLDSTFPIEIKSYFKPD